MVEVHGISRIRAYVLMVGVCTWAIYDVFFGSGLGSL